MLKPIRSILFATDLSINCQQALEYTMALATSLKATVYMLHVIERLPEHVDARLKDLLGRHQWDDLVNSHQMNARRSLLGKKTTNVVVREAVREFCQETGIDDVECDFSSREIIISEGDIIEEVLSQAEKNECDLIVLGTHRTVFANTSVGSKTKGILRRAKIAVMVVPPNPSHT